MSQEQKLWFIISNGSAPVYKHPTFQSSWVSEVVYGESCKILIVKKNWIQIKVKVLLKSEVTLGGPRFLVFFDEK